MSVFLAAESWPFIGALGLLVILTVIEGASLMTGVSASHWIDGAFDDPTDSVHGAADTFLGWLHLGKVPALVLLVIFLMGFALTGFMLNMIALRVTSAMLPVLLSTPVAFAAGLPFVRVLGGVVAKIMPKDETYAVSLDTLVGRVAAIVNGTARLGYPAQAKVATEHGQTVYVMVEPDHADITFTQNDSVLLVRRVSGTRFQAIRNPKPDLL
jgi:hypothetical protein